MSLLFKFTSIVFASAFLSFRGSARSTRPLSVGVKSIMFRGGADSSGQNEHTDGTTSSEGSNEKIARNDSNLSETLGFKVLNENLVYDGWRKIVRKEVVLPNEKKVLFDVVAQQSPSVTVFIWDRESSTATLVQEYHPGVNKMMYGAVAGVFEGHKHESILDCAKSELEEEAQLSTDTWIPLMGDIANSVPFEKYSENRLHSFLALDCQPVLNPKPLDDEEYIIIHRNVDHPRLLEMIFAGELNIISSYTVLMGLRKLKEMGIPLSK